jgi:hypothetical protein
MPSIPRGGMPKAGGAGRTREIRLAGDAVRQLGMRFNAGHALNYFNVQPVAQLTGIRELHIGHAIISRAVFVGLREAVREMKRLLREAQAQALARPPGHDRRYRHRYRRRRPPRRACTNGTARARWPECCRRRNVPSLPACAIRRAFSPSASPPRKRSARRSASASSHRPPCRTSASRTMRSAGRFRVRGPLAAHLAAAPARRPPLDQRRERLRRRLRRHGAVMNIPLSFPSAR